jgi:cytochrome c553
MLLTLNNRFRRLAAGATTGATSGLAAVAVALAVAAAGAASIPGAGVAVAGGLAPAAATAEPIGERVAPCTVCHGDQGRAGTDAYYPRIAGKPHGYLANQLINFRDGRRQYALMTHLLDFLPDAYLREMARHFASLDPPYPPPAPATAAPAVLERGRALVVDGDPARALPACVACHGAALMGAEPAMPGLLGLPRDYLNAQIGAWAAGTRRAAAPDCMADVALRLTPQEVAAVSSWLASQPVPPGARPAPATGPLPVPCGGVGPSDTGAGR